MPTTIRPHNGGTFSVRMHSGPQGRMPYRLYVPAQYNSAERYPLIIWLHGAGGAGSDNAAQITGDQVPGTKTWTTPEQQAAHPAFVLAPQAQASWADDKEDDLTPADALVLQIVDAVTAEFPIDEKRVYLLGQSMGGAGAWNLLTNQPDRFAAVVLVCPVIYSSARAPRVSRVPIWIFMGADDGLAAAAREVVLALRKAGGTPRYTEYPKAGHDIWTRVFKDPELIPWLFGQVR